MTLSVYDKMGDFYYEFVQRNLTAPDSVLSLATQTLLALVGVGVGVGPIAGGYLGGRTAYLLWHKEQPV